MPIKFSVTLYGSTADAEFAAAQKLWAALEREHAEHEGFPNNPLVMLIGAAKYGPVATTPPMCGQRKRRAA